MVARRIGVDAWPRGTAWYSPTLVERGGIGYTSVTPLDAYVTWRQMSLIASTVTDFDSGIADLTFRLMALSGFLTGSLLILVGS